MDKHCKKVVSLDEPLAEKASNILTKGAFMDSSVVLVTPELAKKFLEHNTSNRNLRSALVDLYAKQMLREEWFLTHQGIAFNCDGTLLDGQHRLAAVVKSGKAVHMLVTRGVQTIGQIVMDDHAKRTAGDSLSLARGEEIPLHATSIIRAAIEFFRPNSKNHMLTKIELLNVWDDFAPAVKFVNTHVYSNVRGIKSSSAKAAIVLAWFYVDDLDRLQWFCDVLTGRAMPDGPDDRSALVLREYLLGTARYGYLARFEAFKKTQRAIYAFMRREPLTRLVATQFFYKWPLVLPVRTAGDE